MLNKRLIIYGGVTVFCGVFSFVYEYFSHGVYSVFMVYLFAIPLVLGVLPSLVAFVAPRLRATSQWSRLLQNFAVATLAVGSTLQGVLEIYGTTSPYIIYYFGLGVVFLAVSVVLWVSQFIKQSRAT